jgi:serine-type D-Ala-D-Ala carboxypeptidase (penicillin-binding protein 5/6)
MKDFQQLKVLILSKLKKHKITQTDIQLLLLPVIFFLLLLIIYMINLSLKLQIAYTDLSPAKDVQIQPYPRIRGMFNPVISAEAAVVMDDATKVLLYVKNPDIRFSMASTTKLMTALVALDHFKMDDVITVYSPNNEGAKLGVIAGQKFFFRDLLYAMLLPSANDAALTIAENYPGGVAAFVSAMNEKAQHLHLINTHYSDPTGLQDDGNYTTVVDLARLTSIAMQNKIIAEVSHTRKKVITTIDGFQSFELYNLNILLGNPEVVGGKTGYTEGAGGVLVTVKIENDRRYIVVVMRSNDRFADSEALYGLISENILLFRPQIPLGI